MNLYNYTLRDLKNIIKSLGYNDFNAKQIYDWLYKKKVKSFEEMTNIKKELREHLVSNYTLDLLSIEDKQVSKDGTVKYLFKLSDNEYIETVLMKQEYGNSVCVTSQLGCNMGCKFCASGQIKKQRDLETHEIVRQILTLEEDLNIKVSHVVVMGIGEPLDNFENVSNFLDIINNDNGLQIGARHITVSTCGLIEKIIDFANLNKQYNLAISLHAPNDLIRNNIMPINNKYDINSLIDACKKYVDITNRRITFEYILLKDINDSISDANELSDLIRGINCYVNLIPYNDVDGNIYKPTKKDKALSFYDQLKRRGIGCTLRKELGSEIDAACGQLRSKKTIK